MASAGLLIAVTVILLLIDAVSTEYEVSPLILVPLLLAAAGLLAVDLPDLRR